MKRLLVLRHAKSDHGPGQGDHARPLAPRGRRAAPRVGAWLAERGLRPDVVLCSSAARTRETLELLGDAVADSRVAVEDGLYLAAQPQLVSRLQAVEEPAGDVLLIGHNPGVHALVRTLARPGSVQDRLARGFPTAALAVLILTVGSWQELAEGSADLVDFVAPRDLGVA